MTEHIDGVNKCRMTPEGNRIRVDCFLLDSHGIWQHVYGGLHPVGLPFTALLGVTQ